MTEERAKRSRSNSSTRKREIRQKDLREYLSTKATVQHLISNIVKIEKLDPKEETFTNDLAKLKTANDQRLKLLNKYLPDLKSTELTGGDGEGLTIKVVKFGDLPTE